ncbi:hypothetical protein KAX29_00860 [candidate division WOR-3 bacterium]|nr:hypothetical protein [candidate division WOR-3 bacterium]
MWGLFNALMIWFTILNPEPHHSYLSHLGSLSLPSGSLGLCENDKRKVELGTGLKVSSGRFGELGIGATANFSLKFRLPQRYFGEIHIADLSDEKQPYSLTFLGLGIGKYFEWKNKDFRTRFSFSYMYYYELSDKYTFTNINVEILKPFHWGKYFQPYIGIQGEIGHCGFPENISSNALLGFSPKIISGINFQYKWFNSCFSLVVNRGNFSPAFSISFLK